MDNIDKNSKKGLQHLDDETLAQIVESQIERVGELKSQEVFAAFNELSSRTPER